jgi:vacuolar-type H+-ATPase subunit E/Vma4
MSLSTIIQKIDAEAEASRQKLLAQAHAEAERIIEQARADAEQEAADILQRGENDLQSFTQKQTAAAMLQVRNRKLENRQQLLEDVLAQALQQILACDDTQFKAVMKTILLSVAEEQAGKIFPAKADKKLFSKEFIEEINTELKKNKRKLQFTVASQTSGIPRGCVIDFQDFEMNYSLENILAHLWEQVKHEVSAQLFGDGNN